MSIPLQDPPDIESVVLTVTFNNQVLRGVFGEQCLQFPANGPAIRWGTGVPAATLGVNSDWYFRQDGTAGACIYQKRSGSWAATGA